MTLDPQVAALLTLLPPPVPVGSRTPDQLRAAYEELVATRRGEGWLPEPVGSSQDQLIDGVPCRLHRPKGAERPAVLVYLHGGGWIVGGLDSHEGVARALCHRAGIAVLAVDYRLAPEHPYPAALQDCLAAVRWAGSQEFACVGVGGDSAGAASPRRSRSSCGPRAVRSRRSCSSTPRSMPRRAPRRTTRTPRATA